MASGRPTAAISETRATRRSIRSTPGTSRRSRSRGVSRRTTSGRGPSSISKPRRSSSTACSIRRAARAVPSSRSMRQQAKSSGFTQNAKAGGVPRGKRNVKGYVRGFDVRTGKRLWIFHTIPLVGEFGHHTWENESWVYTGNAGVWAQMSIDEDLGLAYLPVELPTGDYYGGHRPGAGLFGESVVAVDFTTGKRKWHYQLVHHGIWDMDIPCAPVLVDITVGGRNIK